MLADSMNWSAQFLNVTCGAFTGITLAQHFISGDVEVGENLIVGAVAGGLFVFLGPIVRAKVENGQEVDNG